MWTIISIIILLYAISFSVPAAPYRQRRYRTPDLGCFKWPWPLCANFYVSKVWYRKHLKDSLRPLGPSRVLNGIGIFANGHGRFEQRTLLLYYTTFGFCLSGLFLWRLLQARPVPRWFSKEEMLEIAGARFVQAADALPAVITQTAWKLWRNTTWAKKTLECPYAPLWGCVSVTLWICPGCVRDVRLKKPFLLHVGLSWQIWQLQVKVFRYAFIADKQSTEPKHWDCAIYVSKIAYITQRITRDLFLPTPRKLFFTCVSLSVCLLTWFLKNYWSNQYEISLNIWI